MWIVAGISVAIASPRSRLKEHRSGVMDSFNKSRAVGPGKATGHDRPGTRTPAGAGL